MATRNGPQGRLMRSGLSIGLSLRPSILESHHELLSLTFNLCKLKAQLRIAVMHLFQLSLHSCIPSLQFQHVLDQLIDVSKAFEYSFLVTVLFRERTVWNGKISYSLAFLKFRFYPRISLALLVQHHQIYVSHEGSIYKKILYENLSYHS